MSYVLVHGGGFDGSCWDLVVPHLDGAVHAVDLPGRGRRPADLDEVTIADSVAAVVDEIEQHDLRDVVLVGHSLAGVVLPEVAEQVSERLKRLVFVACTVPPHGERVIDLLDPATREMVERHAGNARRSALLPVELATTMFCNGMDEAQLRWTLDHMLPEGAGVPPQPVDLRGLDRPVPRTWIRLLRDAIVPLERQDRTIGRMGHTEVIDLDTSHMAMITRPLDLAALLRQLHD